MNYKAERNRVFKMIWSLTPKSPDMTLETNIPISENRSVTDVCVHWNKKDDYDVSVTVTFADGRFKTFRRDHNTFLQAFTIVSRLTVYKDQTLLAMFDRMANAEPLALMTDSGPLRVYDHYPDGHVSPYYDADTWREVF